MKLPKDRENDYSREVMEARAEFLAKMSGQKIDYLHNSVIDPELARGNIENIIGFAQLPVGVIGPLTINGEHTDGDLYVPLGTSEGALVASYNRGARAISLSGGVNVLVTKDQIQRAPYFILENVFRAKDFTTWLAANFDKLREVTGQSTNHGKLTGYSTYIHGRIVYVRLEFSSGDAMGMNMITRASQDICQFIQAHYPIQGYAIESNMAVDKKPSQINTILGRGKTVTAEVLLKEQVIKRFLRTTAQNIDNAYRRQVAGGQLAGVMGSNGHLANGIAALFMACG
ncbi:MAG: 3-hydroxy-3-methylglutaryl-CoA reductase, partial [Bacteroidales bacterium]